MLFLFQLVYGSFDFGKGNRVVDRRHAWLLFKKVQDCVVDGAMVAQDFVEMRAKH